MHKSTGVGKSALVLTGSRMAVSLISIVTSMLLARFRTLEEYGTYSQTIMVIDLVSTIFLLGLPNSINYFLAKAEDDDGRRTFLSVYVTLSTIFTLLIGGCLIGTMPMIMNYFNNPYISTFAYVFLMYPWSMIMINSTGSVCIVYDKTNKLFIFTVAQSLSSLAILFIAKLANIPFRDYMFMNMVLLMGFAIIGLCWIGMLSGKLQISLDKKLIQEVFTFSIPMGLSSVVGTLNVELDKLVIGRFFTTEEYAIFANAAKELPVTMVAGAVSTVLLPVLVRLLRNQKNEEAAELWKKASVISFSFMFLIVGGFFVFAPDIMSLFYSDKYVTTDGVTVFRIYALILLFRSVYWGIILNAMGKTKFILWSSILTLILNFVGNIGGYYLFGFIGPAISSLLVTGVMAVTQLDFTGHCIHISPWCLMPLKDISILAMQTLVLGILFWFVKNRILSGRSGGYSIVISIVLGILWTGIYGFINRNRIKTNWNALNDTR